MAEGSQRSLGPAIFVIGLLGVLIGLSVAYYAVAFGTAGFVYSAVVGPIVGAISPNSSAAVSQAGVQSALAAGRGVLASLVCLVALLGAGLGLRFPFASALFLSLAAVGYGAALWVFGLIPAGFMVVASVLGFVEAITAEPGVGRYPVTPPTPTAPISSAPVFKPLKGHL